MPRDLSVILGGWVFLMIENNADVNGLDKYQEAPMKRAAYNGPP